MKKVASLLSVTALIVAGCVPKVDEPASDAAEAAILIRL